MNSSIFWIIKLPLELQNFKTSKLQNLFLKLTLWNYKNGKMETLEKIFGKVLKHFFTCDLKYNIDLNIVVDTVRELIYYLSSFESFNI